LLTKHGPIIIRVETATYKKCTEMNI
jgi:hypothetical protein